MNMAKNYLLETKREPNKKQKQQKNLDNFYTSLSQSMVCCIGLDRERKLKNKHTKKKKKKRDRISLCILLFTGLVCVLVSQKFVNPWFL